ncbi:MAG: ROK family protein [Hespellia sp.]|nr:ROK family protein [Hespellia sp.]
MKYLACDFGGSSVKYALIDNQAVMKKNGKVKAPLGSAAEFENTVFELYEKYKNEIEGIAISMPGYINPENGILYDSGAYKQMYGKNIVELLQKKCPVDIAIENDGKCAALAEAWQGALSENKDGAVIILGSGIAGGLIKDGKIHSGRNFAAGELSYMITDSRIHNEMSCAYMSAAMHGITYRICKMKNLDLTIQDSASILTWLDSRIKMPYQKSNEPLKAVKADGIQFFKWLDEDDEDAKEVYKKFIEALAVVVHNVQICYAPEKIVIGGGLSLQERIFKDLRDELQKYYDENTFGRQLEAVVEKSSYLDECNLIGATYNFIQRFPVKGE